MSKKKYCIIFLIAFLFVGCPTRSLFPLFSEKDLVLNPSLLGTWTDTSKNEGTMTFQQCSHNRYTIISCDIQNKDTTVFEAQLGQIGKYWFLDTYLAQKMCNEYVIPIHYYSKIWMNGDTLRYATLDNEYLKKVIDKGELNIPHVDYDGDILLTASPEELQQLALRFADDEHAFSKPEILIRLK